MITQVTHTKAASWYCLRWASAVAAAVTASKPKDNSRARPTTDPIVVTVPTTEPESTLPATMPDTVPETTAGDETTSTTPTAIAASRRAGPGAGRDWTSGVRTVHGVECPPAQRRPAERRGVPEPRRCGRCAR